MKLITEINFEWAIQRAKECDEQIKLDREIIHKYELFGIPLSVKETYIMKGFDCTIGTARRCFQPYDHDGI